MEEPNPVAASQIRWRGSSMRCRRCSGDSTRHRYTLVAPWGPPRQQARRQAPPPHPRGGPGDPGADCDEPIHGACELTAKHNCFLLVWAKLSAEPVDQEIPSTDGSSDERYNCSNNNLTEALLFLSLHGRRPPATACGFCL